MTGTLNFFYSIGFFCTYNIFSSIIHATRFELIVCLSKQALSQSSQAGFGAGAQGQYAPTVPGGQPRPTGIAPQPVPLASGLDIHGYAMDDEEMMKLRAERGGRAGGWSIELSKRRALEEAFASIWI